MLLLTKINDQIHDRQQIPQLARDGLESSGPIADVFEANLARYQAGEPLLHLMGWGKGVLGGVDELGEGPGIPLSTTGHLDFNRLKEASTAWLKSLR